MKHIFGGGADIWNHSSAILIFTTSLLIIKYVMSRWELYNLVLRSILKLFCTNLDPFLPFSTAWGSRYWAEFQSVNRVGFETVHETYSQQVYCDWLLYTNSTKWHPLVNTFAENIWSILDVIVCTFNLPDSSSWGVTFHRWITLWGFDYGVSNFKPCYVHIVQRNSGRSASSFKSQTTRYLVASWTCYANGCFLNSGYKWACEYKAKLHQSGTH